MSALYDGQTALKRDEIIALDSLDKPCVWLGPRFMAQKVLDTARPSLAEQAGTPSVTDSVDQLWVSLSTAAEVQRAVVPLLMVSGPRRMRRCQQTPRNRAEPRRE